MRKIIIIGPKPDVKKISIIRPRGVREACESIASSERSDIEGMLARPGVGLGLSFG